jgi:hypothetical protein
MVEATRSAPDSFEALQRAIALSPGGAVECDDVGAGGDQLLDPFKRARDQHTPVRREGFANTDDRNSHHLANGGYVFSAVGTDSGRAARHRHLREACHEVAIAEHLPFQGLAGDD